MADRAANDFLKPLPEIRPAGPADAPQITDVHIAAWAETYAGILSPERIARTFRPERLRIWQRILTPSESAPVVFVVVPEGQIAGFLCLGPQRNADLRTSGFGAEVSALYLLRAVQGRGLGRALMSTAAHWLLDHRKGGGLALWALQANRRACGFYAALGGREVARDESSDGLQIAFGWPQVEALL